MSWKKFKNSKEEGGWEVLLCSENCIYKIDLLYIHTQRNKLMLKLFS